MTLPTTASRAAVSCIFLALAAGCASKKDATKDNFKAAINTYYSAHPECLWSTTVKFPTPGPAPASTSTPAGFDALTDQGLLARQADSRKVFIFGSKEVSDYDLTDKGRAAWTADPQNPGSGNFCYGHRDVTTVDDLTANGGTATADYHYQLGGVAPWADNAELKTARSPNAPGASSGLPKDEDMERALSFTERFMRRIMRIFKEEANGEKS